MFGVIWPIVECALGIAAAHYTLLVMVHAEPGLTGAELARRLMVSPQAIASLVARLDGRGLLERREHPRHRHVQELHLTAAGAATLRTADEVIAEVEAQVVQSLGARRADQLRQLLDDVTAAVAEPR